MTLEVARQLVERLAQLERRVVFAESCTGGLIAAELAGIPGVSDWLCGSAVTYRCDTKVRWLGVSADDIDQHTSVSAPVAHQMAIGVLRNTPEASFSASVTGHLGPAAPAELDGVVFVGIAVRRETGIAIASVSQHQLETGTRQKRQSEAAALVLRSLMSKIA